MVNDIGFMELWIYEVEPCHRMLDTTGRCNDISHIREESSSIVPP